MAPLAWDTETRSFRWWENPAFLGSAAHNIGGQVGGGQVANLTTGRGRTRLKGFLKQYKHLVGANSKFDAHMTREIIGLDVLDPKNGYRVDDVLLMSKLVYGARRSIHGLKELATDLIDPGAKDAEEEMQAAYKSVSGRSDMKHDNAYYDTWLAEPELVEKYAALDAVYTRKLYDILKPQIDEDAKLSALYELEVKVQTVLYNAERIGVRVDQEAVARLAAHYRKRDAEARGALQRELGFVPEGTGSADALREALVKAGVELTERTPETGEFAVNRKALQPYATHPAVAALFEWRRVNKFLSTYVGPLEARDAEVVHTNFKQAEAWTGRMAAAQPNMQNLPKRSESTKEENLKVRSVYIPREGMEFLIADFEGIEARVLAHMIGLKDYARIVSEGDPHAITAAAAWGGVPENYYKSTPQRWLRDIAKHTTYSIFFGGGGPVVMDTINKMVIEAGHPEFMVDLDQAKAIRKKITGAIPGFKELTDTPWRGQDYPRGRIYQQLLDSQVGDFGYVRTIGGRKQWIKLDKAYVGLSGLIQGSAADIMKQASVNVTEVLKPSGAYPLLFVHDELVVECPLGEGENLKPLVTDAMVSAATLLAPLSVEAHVTSRSYAHAE